jgi:hypothetical protein
MGRGRAAAGSRAGCRPAAAPRAAARAPPDRTRSGGPSPLAGTPGPSALAGTPGPRRVRSRSAGPACGDPTHAARAHAAPAPARRGPRGPTSPNRTATAGPATGAARGSPSGTARHPAGPCPRGASRAATG